MTLNKIEGLKLGLESIGYAPELTDSVIRAVNAHEELLEACKFLVEQHRFLQSHTSMQLPARIYTAIEKAAQAIAKAEEK